ncbi:MAG: hypothetical protein ACRDN0_03365, partial [Trebonia sp.]
WRRHTVRRRFGPEYDRLADEAGPRHAREELTRRARAARQLDIRPLSQRQREEYGRRWIAAQERFIDRPEEATRTAEALVTTVAGDLGYTTDDEEKLFTELSVEHARALDRYRHGKEASGQMLAAEAPAQPTEVLRQSLLEYRVLFRELLVEANDGAASPPAPAESGRVTADATKE